MARKKSKDKRKRGTLIKHYLQQVKASSFDAVGKEIKSILRGQPGIYALHKGEKLWYVGLATDLKNRIPWHLRDRHAKKWDNFSIFIVRNVKYLRDLERTVVQIAQPKGNKILKKKRDTYLTRELRQLVKEKRKTIYEKRKTRENQIKLLKEEIEKIEEAVS